MARTIAFSYHICFETYRSHNNLPVGLPRNNKLIQSLFPRRYSADRLLGVARPIVEGHAILTGCVSSAR